MSSYREPTTGIAHESAPLDGLQLGEKVERGKSRGPGLLVSLVADAWGVAFRNQGQLQLT